MNQPRSESEPNDPPKPAPTAPRKRAPKLNVPKPPEPPPPPHWLVRLAKAPALVMVVWPLLLVVGGYVVWNRWGYERLSQQYNRLSADQVTVTPPPEYIRTNIVGAVFESHQLEKISLLNRLATAAIAEAFRTHPWVEEVLRVEKRASGVDIHLRYRKPVALVRVVSKHPKVTGDAFFVIDAQGVLLPREDFSEADGNKYLHIEIPNTYPSGDIGAPYGDDRVLSAAKLAATLDAHWQGLQVRAIGMENPNRTFNESWIYSLFRQDRTKVVWGSPPGEELPGELSAAEKLARLQETPTVSDLRR